MRRLKIRRDDCSSSNMAEWFPVDLAEGVELSDGTVLIRWLTGESVTMPSVAAVQETYDLRRVGASLSVDSYVHWVDEVDDPDEAAQFTSNSTYRRFTVNNCCDTTWWDWFADLGIPAQQVALRGGWVARNVRDWQVAVLMFDTPGPVVELLSSTGIQPTGQVYPEKNGNGSKYVVRVIQLDCEPPPFPDVVEPKPLADLIPVEEFEAWNTWLEAPGE